MVRALLFAPLIMLAAGCTVAAACSAPIETTDPTPWDDNIDGLQACTETCTLKAQRCQEPMECAAWCAEMFKNSGAECKDELTAQWACMLFYYKAEGPECQGWPRDPCLAPFRAAIECANEYGCATHDWWTNQLNSICISGLVGPNEEQGCRCDQVCGDIQYRSECWTLGPTSFCECSGNGIKMGTCEGGPEPFCDPNAYNGCCNQYFMIDL